LIELLLTGLIKALSTLYKLNKSSRLTRELIVATEWIQFTPYTTFFTIIFFLVPVCTGPGAVTTRCLSNSIEMQGMTVLHSVAHSLPLYLFLRFSVYLCVLFVSVILWQWGEPKGSYGCLSETNHRDPLVTGLGW
jgi:hypothetical protein